MTRRRVEIEIESFAFKVPFVISRAVRKSADVVTVTLSEGGMRGRGECRPIERYDETCESAAEEIRRIAPDLEAGLGRSGLGAAMPPGAARNAVDCALWDLEAKTSQKSVWQLSGVKRPDAINTAFSLSLSTPQEMARLAAQNRDYGLIKLKLGGDGTDADRIAAVRAALPHARLIADANEALTEMTLPPVLHAAEIHRLEMLEQPLPAGSDNCLEGITAGVTLCADESCHTRADLPVLAGRYGMINIKLDKTGGLTEALALEKAAREAGFSVMVGCMFSTSLGIAPAQIAAARADIVDLDAPLFLGADRMAPIRYAGSRMEIAVSALWG